MDDRCGGAARDKMEKEEEDGGMNEWVSLFTFVFFA